MLAFSDEKKSKYLELGNFTLENIIHLINNDKNNRYLEFIYFQQIAYLLKKLILNVLKLSEIGIFHSDLKPANIIF